MGLVRAQLLLDSLVADLVAAGTIKTPAVEAAMRAVPRHLFVPRATLEEAYRDEAIATKMLDGRAVSSASQPSVVAQMLEQLDVRPGEHVLEIGAGTAYNAALLGHLVGRHGSVVTVDIDDDIVKGARRHLAAVQSTDVEVVCGDGGLGHGPGAPYDRIVLTVGASDLTPAWWDQLRPGGRLLLPLALRGVQRCVAFDEAGGFMHSASVRDCGFMRLRGGFRGSETVKRVGPVTVSIPGEVEASAIEHVLDAPAGRRQLDLEVNLRECLGGLALWLALEDEEMCSVDTVWPRGHVRPFPVLASFPSGERIFGWSVARFDGAGLAALSFEAGRLTVECFGEDRGNSERLAEAAQRWDAAGRPDTSSLRVHAHRSPRGEPGAQGLAVVRNRWTTFEVEWPAGHPAQSPG